MTSVQTIESQDLSIDKLFDDFYIVPNYQREFVWEEKQVEELLDDIYNEFRESQTPSDAEYFVGSIVVCTKPDRVFELIDGQQRMTTIYILFCAIQNYLKECNVPDISTLSCKIAAPDVDSKGNNVFRYRVELQYEDSGDILKSLTRDSIILNILKSDTRSVKNIKNAYQVIYAFLQREFKGDESNLRMFYYFFTKKVKLIRICTQNIAHALKIFETINDRGKGLDSMDLLKNLMFMRAKPEEFERLKVKWKQLVDILHEADEKPLRFLRYFIFATYIVDQSKEVKEDKIYDWFIENEDKCQYRSNAIGFVNELLIAAKAYRNFVNGKNAQGNTNRYLKNIRCLSGSAKQHLILLLAGRNLPEDSFSELCRHVENLFFVYIITRKNTREFERKFAQWSSEIRSISNQDELKAFINNQITPAKQEQKLCADFDLTFNQLNSLGLQRYRIRYILGKLTQYINEMAYGKAWVDLQTFINKDIHIEHILPQNPSEKPLDEFDKIDVVDTYICSLGNLTLIEEPLNEYLGNKPFSIKKDYYPKSKFILTNVISGRDGIGHTTIDTAIDAALQGGKPFDTWKSIDIEERQKRLSQLARLVWEMDL